MSRILILVNHYNTLRIFRRELLIEMHNQGHEVIASVPECDEENKTLLESYGCRVIFTAMERRGMNPLKDIGLFFRYLKLIKKIHPDKVITYTIKSNIYGSMACKIKKVPHYVNITGLGSAFQAQGGMMRKLVSVMYKVSLNKADKIFFENEGNRDTLVNDKIVKASQTVVMPGAGVNLTEFYPAEYPPEIGGINFLFVGRIMKEKGVDELFWAIKEIKKQYDNVTFSFIGWYEESYQEIVEQMQQEGLISFYGFQSEVRPFIEKAHCVILPSWHEGMSNTLLESAAMCRPLITNDIHGCKEAVEDTVSGYLVRLKDEKDLYEKIEKFIELSYEEKLKMGLAGRQWMEKNFDKKKVVQKSLQQFDLL